MPGRPPKPTALKVLHGTARPDRVNANEPKPEGFGKRPPAWLKGRARTHWGRIQPIVEGMRVSTDADPVALALLCDALAQYVQASDVLRTKGNNVELFDEDGRCIEYRPRTEVRIVADAWRRVNLMLQQFGLTPASRAKVQAAEAQEIDPVEAFLSGRRSG